MSDFNRKCIAVCDTQPLTAEGVRAVVERAGDLTCVALVRSLGEAMQVLESGAAKVVVVDKGFGVQPLMEWLGEARRHQAAPVVWGTAVSEAEALRLLQAGARGILRKTATPDVLLACLRAVSAGNTWMEDTVFREASRMERYPRSELTARERQVLELVQQGLKNKEIARELGIRPGTVKIHLKHIFEKTGVRGRYGLALSGLKEKGLLSLPHV